MTPDNVKYRVTLVVVYKLSIHGLYKNYRALNREFVDNH